MKALRVGKTVGKRGRLSSRRGQNTVEYLLMLTVIVGVVILVGHLMKGSMSDLWASIIKKISGAADNLGQ